MNNDEIIDPPVVSADEVEPASPKKRRSGIPTGNAGEYFVMGELLRRGYDAQLADRNTKGYDLLVGKIDDQFMQKVQVKTVRNPPWYVAPAAFSDERVDQVTIYVLVGSEKADKPVRYFIARNRDLVGKLHIPPGWDKSAFVHAKVIAPFEGKWDTLFEGVINAPH